METEHIIDGWQTCRLVRTVAVLAVLVTLGGVGRVVAQPDFCWRNTQPRGAGEVLDISTCANPSWEKDPHGLLCYPRCQAGYQGAGPVCWQSCPAGFRDDGAYCAKPEAYGRGGGYPWQGGDGLNSDGMFSRCNRDNPQGCEEVGAIVYPKCKANFHMVGSNICSPDCPSGMTDIGVSCQKKSYGRGAGGTLGCASGMEQDGLLCYRSCGASADGVGPVCWDHCPKNWVQCGMGCAKDSGSCASATADQVISVLSAVGQIAADVLTAGGAGEAISGAEGGVKAAKAAKDAAELAKSAGGKAEELLGGSKQGIKAAGEELAKQNENAISDAAARINKLNLSGAFKHFDKSEVTSTRLLDAMKENRGLNKSMLLTKTVQGVDEGAKMYNTIGGIVNDSTMSPDLKNFEIAETVLSSAAMLDPTGIMGIVSAYTKPECNLVVGPPVVSSSPAPPQVAASPTTDALLPQHLAYINATTNLTRILGGAKDVNTANSAKPAIAVAIQQVEISRAGLVATTAALNAEAVMQHRAPLNNSTPQTQVADALLAAQVTRIRSLPDVYQALQATLANLK